MISSLFVVFIRTHANKVQYAVDEPSHVKMNKFTLCVVKDKDIHIIVSKDVVPHTKWQRYRKAQREEHKAYKL